MQYNAEFPILFLNQYQLNEEKEFSNDTVDFIYVLSGKISVLISGEDAGVYRSSDIRLIPGRRPYRLLPVQEPILIHLGLASSFIEKYVGPTYSLICDSRLEPNRNYQEVKRLLTLIASQYMDVTASNELTIYSLLFQLADWISKNCRFSMPDSVKKNAVYQDRVAQILLYLNRNYSQPVTLTSLADALHLTPQYLSKIFKSYFSVNFNEYLTQLRISHARRDLLYSSRSITEIAIGNGFPSLPAFTRHFRSRFGMSPQEYRGKNTLSLPPADRQIVSDIISSTAQSSRDIAANVTESSSFRQDFCALINIGFARNFQSVTFQRQFLLAHEELHFHYIRMEDLVSNALIPRLIDGQYYFTNVASILDFLQQHGLVPFIELGRNSYYRFGDNSGNAALHGHGISPKFLAMFRAFLEFVTNRYDPSWYSQWIFELWMAPSESVDLYLNRYREAKAFIRDLLPGASFGGPGYDTALPPKKFEDYLQAAAKKDIRPDFISLNLIAYKYSMDSQEETRVLAMASHSLREQQAWCIARIREAFGRSVPLYITEFNSTILLDTYVNASCFQSTFLCKNLLELSDASPLIGYWLLSDLAFSLATPRVHPRNGLGLINTYGVRMPAFHAYSMLNRLGGRLIEKGEGYCITAKTKDSFQILAYHYAPIADYRVFTDSGEFSLLDLYGAFQEQLPISMSFHLTGIEPGMYRIKRYLLDRYHGSLLDIYIGGLNASTIEEPLFLEKMQTPSPALQQYFRSTCIPEERTIFLDIQKELSLSISLFSHNVCFWEIDREY